MNWIYNVGAMGKPWHGPGARKASFSTERSILEGLSKVYPGTELGVRFRDVSADAVIQQKGRYAIVEILTGDPTLPLPSATPAKMKHYMEVGRAALGADGTMIVLTNYEVPTGIERELETAGVKLLRYSLELPLAEFFKEFAEKTGLEFEPRSADKKAGSPSPEAAS